MKTINNKYICQQNVYFSSLFFFHSVQVHTQRCACHCVDSFSSTHKCKNKYIPCPSPQSFQSNVASHFGLFKSRGLIRERFVSLGHKPDGVKTGNPSLTSAGVRPPRQFGGGVTAFAKSLITARWLLDRGHSSKGKGRATPRIHS